MSDVREQILEAVKPYIYPAKNLMPEILDSIEALIQEQVRLARMNELRIVPSKDIATGFEFDIYRRKRLRELKGDK